jgi:hypothetical protein
MLRVNVEGSPEAVAKFFKEMGKESFEYPKIGQAPLDDFSNVEYEYRGEKPEPTEANKGTVNPDVFVEEAQKEKIAELVETDPKVIEKVTGKKPGRPKKEKAVEPEVVTPDPEFSDLPDVAENATTEAPEIAEEPEKPSVTREMVQAALKEYGLWLDQGRTVPRGQIKPYLLALLRKYGNKGVTGTPDLEEQYFEAVMNAAVSRIPPFELEEFV